MINIFQALYICLPQAIVNMIFTTSQTENRAKDIPQTTPK